MERDSKTALILHFIAALCSTSEIELVYRVKQNLGKQVLRIPCPKFRSPSSSFVVFIHGQRDLSSIPWKGGAAVGVLLQSNGI